MRILKWLLYIVILLAVVLVGGAFLLPKSVAVARSIEIDAPASKIFPHVNSLQAAAEWSPWLGRDPEIKLTYTGPDSGVGNALAWESEHPNVGNGSQVIVASELDKMVQMDLDFGPMGTAVAEFVLDGGADQTTVTWGFTTDLGNNPMARWMGLMMDKWVGGDYEAGLGNLKTLVEG